MKKSILLNVMLLLLSWSINAQTATMPSGSGLYNDPYQISSLENLYWLTTNKVAWDKYFIQTADINASATSGWSSGWLPIGNWYAYQSAEQLAFTGTYDGGGYTISGLHIKDITSCIFYGFFGSISSATIKNLGIIDVVIDISIDGNTPSGALAGYSAGSLFENCYSSGSVQNLSSGNCGGLVGNCSGDSRIIDSYSSCSVKGTHSTGGLIGINSHSSITNCYYISGTVDGSGSEYSSTGGLVGTNDYYGIISKCYSTGTITGYDNAGGLVGVNARNSQISDCYSRCSVSTPSGIGYMSGGFTGDNDATSTMTNCYSTGLVSGIVRGFLGNSQGGDVINCFWDTETSLAIRNEGGTDKTTAEMKTTETFTDAGWDFETIWYINADINDGYPNLQALAPTCTNGTIALFSGSNTQTVCTNTEIECIIYAVNTGDMHTVGASISPALPPGLTGHWLGEENRYMICGTPTVAGTYTYTVTTIGTDFPCDEGTATGTIISMPEVSISGNNSPIYYGNNAEFYLEGTPDAEVMYSIDFREGGSYTGTVRLNGVGTAIVTAWEVTLDVTLSLVSICNNALGTSTVTVNRPTASISGVHNACTSTTLTAETNASSPTYKWATLKDDEWKVVGEGPTFEVTQSGNYYLWVLDGITDCFSVSEAFEVTISPTPEVYIKQAISEITEGGSVTLTAYGAESYSWSSVPSGFSSSSSEVIVSPVKNTTYTVTGTSNGCSSSDEVIIYVQETCKSSADQYEPNNSMSGNLFTIPIDLTISANLLNAKDPDWYRLDISELAKYTLKLTKSGTVSPSVELYGSNGRKLKSIDRTQPYSYNLANGTYYIKVSAGVKAYLCYTLQVINNGATVGAIASFDDTKSAEIVPTPDGICKIWPNPTNNEFQIYNGNEYPIQMKVMDVTGRQIEIVNNVGIAETVVFGSKYKPGLYFVETSENGVQKVFKVIKQ